MQRAASTQGPNLQDVFHRDTADTPKTLPARDRPAEHGTTHRPYTPSPRRVCAGCGRATPGRLPGLIRAARPCWGRGRSFAGPFSAGAAGFRPDDFITPHSDTRAPGKKRCPNPVSRCARQHRSFLGCRSNRAAAGARMCHHGHAGSRAHLHGARDALMRSASPPEDSLPRGGRHGRRTPKGEDVSGAPVEEFCSFLSEARRPRRPRTSAVMTGTPFNEQPRPH